MGDVPVRRVGENILYVAVDVVWALLMVGKDCWVKWRNLFP